MHFLDTQSPLHEYLLGCIISRFVITIYCPKWYNLKDSEKIEEYLFFGVNVTDNVYLTLDNLEIFNKARVPNNFLVYSQN